VALVQRDQVVQVFAPDRAITRSNEHRELIHSLQIAFWLAVLAPWLLRLKHLGHASSQPSSATYFTIWWALLKTQTKAHCKVRIAAIALLGPSALNYQMSTMVESVDER
jgi:hypothetical protein